MKRFSLVLLSILICFLMFSCDDYTHTPSVSSENTSSKTISDTSSQEATSSESVSSLEDTVLEIIIPEKSTTGAQGHIKVDMGEFYLWLPEDTSDAFKTGEYLWLMDYAIYGNKICYDKSETAVVIEIASIDKIENEDNPFLKYDELYNEEVSHYKENRGIEYYQFGGLFAKRYYYYEVLPLPEETDGYPIHTYVYCIKANDKILVINFIPRLGYGGFDFQTDEFEIVLNSIEMK